VTPCNLTLYCDILYCGTCIVTTSIVTHYCDTYVVTLRILTLIYCTCNVTSFILKAYWHILYLAPCTMTLCIVTP